MDPITTKRLLLVPMTIDLADAAISGNEADFEKLGFHTHGLWPIGDLCDALPFFKEMLAENGPDLFGPWLITRKHDGAIIGDIGFKGPPDEDGTIEIGFSVIPSEQRKGYCFEAAEALLALGIADKRVHTVIAECLIDNTASRALLMKLCFIETSRSTELIRWSYDPTKRDRGKPV